MLRSLHANILGSYIFVLVVFKRLFEAGALKVYSICTHGILSGRALDHINSSRFECVVVTNTIPQERNTELCNKLQVI